MGELVTVVVPARDEELFIGECLASVLAQDHQELEVLVVDGRSSDATRAIVDDIAARDGRVRVLDNPALVIPTALNLALKESNADWLVRVDAHATVPPDYVRRALEHLTTGRWGAVGGRKDGVGRTAQGRAIAAAMASPFGVGGSTYHHGVGTRTVEHVPFGCYPVALLHELGGWDESLRVNQDFELDWRVRSSGREILFDSSLRVEWHCRQHVRDLFDQYRRYGRGKVKVAALHPRSVRPRHLVPPALVAWLAGCALLALRRPGRGVAATLPYAAVLVVATRAAGRDLDEEARRHLPLAFAAMHVGWGLGFWRGVLEVARAGGPPRR